MVESTRGFINAWNKGKSITEWRYYIGGLQFDAAEFNCQVRAHRAIENSCDRALDMIFSNDDCRVRICMGAGAQNFAVLRRSALSLVKQDKSTRNSLNTKRRQAGWSADYLETLVGVKPR